MKFCPQCARPLARREVGGRERDACADTACGFVNWNNPIPVVGGIVEHDGHVILVRNVGWPEHWYGIVTGFLEADEMPEEAILREVKEETGLDATLVSFIGMYEFHRRNQLLIIYHLVAHSNDVRPMAEEIADYKWVAIDQVRPWTAGTGQALADWLRARGIEREMFDFDEVRN